MSAADFGILDFLLDKEMDGCKAFKSTSFTHLEDRNIIKEEILTTDWDADELLNSMLNPSDVAMDAGNAMNSGGGGGSDVMDSCDVIADVMDPGDVMDPNDLINGGNLHAPLAGPVTSKADDLDSLDGLVGLPFDAVLDSGASDSGFSNSDLSFDQQLSPQSVWSTGSGVGGMGTGSPHTALSPDHPGSICSTTSSGSSGVLPSEPGGVADLTNLPGFGPVLGSNTTEGSCGDSLRSPMLSGVGGVTVGASGRTSSTMDVDEFPQPDSGISSPIPQQTSSPQHYSANLNVLTSSTRNSMSNTVTTKSPSTTTTTPLLKTVTLAAPTFNTNTIINSCISSSDPSNTATLTFSSSPSPASSPSPSTSSPSPSTSTTTTLNGMSGQTIVVTQGGGGGSGGSVGPTRNSVGSLVRNGTTTLLKTGANSRSILLPVTVKDLNQVRTIKIISAGSSASGVASRGVRTVVSTVRTPSSGALSSTVVNRRATTLASSATPLVQRNTSTTSSSASPATIGTVRVLDTKGATVLKASSGSSSGASTTIASPVCSSPFAGTSTVTMIKEEHSDDDDDESVQGHPYQQVVLNDEERRLLKKEGIMLPTHYPLTKQEERELKRIRRKIRNKISAQDSRKRKKEYIDGLEDRVKACTEENQELQKRIRHLEAQNESLVTQLRRFQNLVTGGGNLLRNVHSGHTPHTSTALMMLILSAALFIVPSLKPQDANGLDSELSLPTGKMPTTGRSRSLLEAGSGNPSLLQALESVEGLEEEELQDSDVVMSVPSALSDHDYEPPSKRHRMNFKMHDYIVPPLDDIGPKHVTLDKGGTVDRGGTLENSHTLPHMVDYAGNKHNNFSDPGGDGSNNIDAVKRKNQENLMWSPSTENQNSSTGSAQSVVVKLGKTVIDEFELE